MIESQYCNKVRRCCVKWGLETYFVDHHHGEQVAHRRNQQAIKVVAHGCADARAECVQNNLAHDKEEDAKSNVAERPAVMQRPRHQQDLHADVDKQLDRIQHVENDKQANRVGRAQAHGRLEGRERDEERDGKRNQRADAQQPDRQRGSILVQLEADKAVDEEGRHDRAAQTILDGGKIRIRLTARGHDTRVDNERDEGQEHVEVEEGEDLLAADGGELGADVQDHNDGHDEGDNVQDGRGALEDDGVGELDVAREAVGLDAHAA